MARVLNQNNSAAASSKYFARIVKEFFCSSVYVVRKNDDVWCASQFLPNPPNQETASILSELGLHVYDYYLNSNSNNSNSKNIYLLLPTDLKDNKKNNNKNSNIVRVTVDGNTREFYKEFNVNVTKTKSGFIISSCSWFRKENCYLETQNKKQIKYEKKVSKPVRCHARNAEIHYVPLIQRSAGMSPHQTKSPERFCSFHSETEWPNLLDLSTVSMRCFVKAVAMHKAFKQIEKIDIPKRLFNISALWEKQARESKDGYALKAIQQYRIMKLKNKNDSVKKSRTESTVTRSVQPKRNAIVRTSGMRAQNLLQRFTRTKTAPSSSAHANTLTSLASLASHGAPLSTTTMGRVKNAKTKKGLAFSNVPQASIVLPSNDAGNGRSRSNNNNNNNNNNRNKMPLLRSGPSGSLMMQRNTGQVGGIPSYEEVKVRSQLV